MTFTDRKNTDNLHLKYLRQNLDSTFEILVRESINLGQRIQSRGIKAIDLV